MKRIIILCLCLSAILLGCGQKEQAASLETVFTEEWNETTSSTVQTEVMMPQDNNENLISVSIPATSEHYMHDNDTELFTYTAQHMYFLFPDEDIADAVIVDFLNRVDSFSEDAETILESAQANFCETDTWIPYFHQVLYSPTRVDHGILSLFGQQNSYSGGMHGNISCMAANYDLNTGDVLTLGSIMHADATKDDFIDIIVDHLAAIEEEYYLYEDYVEGVRNRLDADENSYEDFYFTSTGLCFFFSPYEIAPYASGVITIEIPYNELPGLIYDGYFPAERDQQLGSMQTSSMAMTNMDNFDNMAEVTIAAGESKIVAYPHGSVERVQIVLPSDGKNMPSYTVFYAYEMSDKDAVVITLPDELLDGIHIQYTSDSINYAIPLSE